MKYISLALFVLTLMSCKKDVESQASKDDTIIIEYLADNNLEATEDASGLYYIIDEPGTGDDYPDYYSKIEVNYKGYLTNNNTFQQGTIDDELYNLLDGWIIGIPYFKKGGKGRLIIPSALGYGSAETGSIPANSVVIFDIELLDFK